MTSYRRFFLVALPLLAAITARADSVAAASPATGNRTVSPVLAVLDRDHDGILSARELATAPVALAALDVDADGKISSNERQALNSEGQTTRVFGRATAFNLVLTLDANSDGDIQLMEIANAASSLQRLDVNGDGQLTPNELRPVMLAQSRTVKSGRSTGS